MGDDQLGFLGQRDEVDRQDEAAARVLPARKRLEADDALRPEVEDRLVVHAELVALEREPELRLDVESLARVAAAEGIEERDARAGCVFAPTRAISASCSMSPAPVAPGAPTPMPMLTLTNHVRPSRSNGGLS